VSRWHAVASDEVGTFLEGDPLVLAGCAVAPGFEFADFRLLGDDPRARARIEAGLPRLAHLL
jgi:predicted cupin superfamily sugar epimerase